MMCELEKMAKDAQKELEQPLEIASLILVHNTGMSIKFRMDEKRFDVDGAYNIRYEILKKRIDKVKLKGKSERLTQPGKISIVYSQKKDAEEYLRYIHHLQNNHFLLAGVEDLELEDLQGISGLKALRVGVNYDHLPSDIITYKELIQVLGSYPEN